MSREKLANPVRLAIIGAGNRSANIYPSSYAGLSPWVELVAVCDPVKEHADHLAQKLGVRAYYDIRQLVADKICEAAIVITPVESHHAISVYLSEHGIHNIVETTWCSTVRQATEMLETAKKNGVITCVAENFFRLAVDRFADIVRDDGCIGKIHRIYSYNDHTGYHNTERWLHFTQKDPEWVQSITHTMPTVRFAADPPTRVYESETFCTKMFSFPDGFAVIDNCSNIKGFLGRQPRPGYTEWQGESGTLVYRGRGFNCFPPEMQIRRFVDYCTNECTDVIYELECGRFKRLYASLPEKTLCYANPYEMPDFYRKAAPDYSMALMDQLVEFACAVRGTETLEYGPERARMALVCEMAAAQSARDGGRRICVGSETDFEVEKEIEKKLADEFHADPYDVEGMIALSYPRK